MTKESNLIKPVDAVKKPDTLVKMKISMGHKKAEKRVCSVCGTIFYGKGNQKTCSHLCSDSPKNLRNKDRKKLENLLSRIHD